MSDGRKLWWFEAWWQLLVILVGALLIAVFLGYNPKG